MSYKWLNLANQIMFCFISLTKPIMFGFISLTKPIMLCFLQVIYYIFAMVGMELFKDKVHFFPPNSTDPHKDYCGNPLLKGTAFAKFNYCKNNFNDVVSSFILLLELTVVNQWHDILF